MINLAHLIDIASAENARENADGSIDLIAADGTVRSATADEIAAAKRLQIRDEINAERQRREALGLVYQFTDGQAGTIQMRNATDFRNIAGLTSAATILTMQGVTDPVLYFTDAENVRHIMTPAQMISMGIAVQQRISSLYAAAADIKNTLETADPDTFYITIGWPE